jgi:putative transposase
MPNYRRADIPGGTYFFTLVSYRRQKILCNDNIRIALRDAIVTTRTKLPFTIDAWVLMPDHLHTIWTLPEGDNAYSVRWSMIKRLVTQSVGDGFGAHGAPYGLSRDGVIGAHGAPNGGVHDNGFVGCAVRTDRSHGALVSASRLKRREGNIWQRRFWEHQVRDQVDFNRCMDYLHWNPVKHGHAGRVADWPYSTFHRFVREGLYTDDWGGSGVVDGGAFGE